MSKILVAYATKSGSTTEVANAIAEELQATGAEVDVRTIEGAGDLTPYDAVVVGAPMIHGWHHEATKFLAKNQQALSRKRVALFLTAKAVTQSSDGTIGGAAMFQDPKLVTPPKNPAKLGFREKMTTPQQYLGPVLKEAPAVKPVAAGFFGGNLEYGKLGWWDRFYVKRIVGAAEGDSRNWDAIRGWAREIAPRLQA